MTASQKTANPNGCAEPTKKDDDGIDTNIEALEEYICDNICRYRADNLSQEELDYFCHHCELQKHTDRIKAEYDKINHFDHSQAMKLMDRYKYIVLCEECEYRYYSEPENIGYCQCVEGICRKLKPGDGCSCGKRKE